jgi:hypothetical protein
MFNREGARDMGLYAEYVENKLLGAPQPDGTDFYCISGKLGALVCPPETSLTFDSIDHKANSYVVGPTCEKTSSGQYVPTEGFKTATQKQYIPRKPADHIQHGGILLDNTTGQFSFMSYLEFLHAMSLPFDAGYCCVEGNWYMDATNCQEVLVRPNIAAINRPYNCLGLMQNDIGEKRLFTLSNFRASVNWIAHTITHQEQFPFGPNMPLAFFAGAASVLAEKYHLPHWQLVGLEFNNGGTYPKFTVDMAKCGGFQMTYPPQNK